jgi:heme A synthase
MIFEYTQSIIAVTVVIGCGILAVFSSVDIAALTGLVGAVIGYYFGSAVSPIARARAKDEGVLVNRGKG